MERLAEKEKRPKGWRRGTDEERGNERKSSDGKKKRERESPRPAGGRGRVTRGGENRERKRGRRIAGGGEGGRQGGGEGGERGGGEGGERGAGVGTGRRGVVLTRTGAFLIIICLSLGISREKKEGDRAATGVVGTGGRSVVGRWKKKEPVQRERKKERERLPKESQGSEWKERESERETGGRE